MIIKIKSVDHDQVAYLNELLGRDLPEPTKEKIERELRLISSGAKGEKDTAYYLDFHFKDTRNWVLIHDLRLEYDGRVAQIDHLLIGRMLDIYVLESKHFSSGVAINEHGEFSYFYHNKPRPIPSPIEQNNRHIRFLQKFLANNDLLPKRLGLTLSPTFRSYVLVSPTSRLTKPTTGTFDTSMVMKADQFISRFNENSEENVLASVANLTKVISQERLQKLATRLAGFHQPVNIDYRKKFGLESEVEDVAGVSETAGASYAGEKSRGLVNGSDRRTSVAGGYFCSACKKPISKKVALFCFTNKARFGGKAFCFDCQKTRVGI